MQGRNPPLREGRRGARGLAPVKCCLALVIATVLLGGCGASGTISPAASSTISPAASFAPAPPTPTLAPASPLQWQARQPPVENIPVSFYSQPIPAASNGDTAYWCVDAPTAGAAAVWATHDRAAHWKLAGRLPSPSPGPVVGCYLVVDDLNPSTVVAAFCASIQETHCSGPANDISYDAGVSWAPVAGVLPLFAQFATRDGVTYALTRTPPHSACFDCTQALAISRDGLRTWTRIDQAITDAGRYVTHFWLEPVTGALLAQTSNHWALQDELWFTTDGGSHWSHTHSPLVDGYVVQALLPGEPWFACGYHSSVSSDHPSYPSLLECSRDGGRTWTDAGGPFVGLGRVFPVAIAADGSILAQWTTPSPLGGGGSPAELRRLPPGGDAWETLGPMPANGSTTYVAGSGVLWLYAGGSGGSSAKMLYTATYP